MPEVNPPQQQPPMEANALDGVVITRQPRNAAAVDARSRVAAADLTITTAHTAGVPLAAALISAVLAAVAAAVASEALEVLMDPERVHAA
ncbi:hypothetical protein Daus18300_005380 [Diaporthe australafricana]|uniref:Uncharacterized protein n=1 Tax=Diaporthe australafricana TaxID=127596 RepID=A0ABR3X1W9_9PEZI